AGGGGQHGCCACPHSSGRGSSATGSLPATAAPSRDSCSGRRRTKDLHIAPIGEVGVDGWTDGGWQPRRRQQGLVHLPHCHPPGWIRNVVDLPTHQPTFVLTEEKIALEKDELCAARLGWFERTTRF